MKAKKLFKKYSSEKHLEKHSLIYAEKFAEFLNKNSVDGIIIDISCGTGRDTNTFKSLK